MYANKNNVQINMNRQEAKLLILEVEKLAYQEPGPRAFIVKSPLLWELIAILRDGAREEE